MKVLIVSGDGHCPSCESIKRKLTKAGIEYEEDKDTGHMYQIATALGAMGRPILLAYSVGDGKNADSLINRIREN